MARGVASDVPRLSEFRFEIEITLSVPTLAVVAKTFGVDTEFDA